jgi:hypothetical protein
VHPLGLILSQGWTCSKLLQAHFTAGVAVREDVFCVLDDFMEKFALVFCPGNKATTVLMQLESDRYFQGKWNVEAYINKFKDLVDLSGYTDPIAIFLKLR